MAAPEFTEKLSWVVEDDTHQQDIQKQPTYSEPQSITNEYDEAYNEAYQVVDGFYAEAQKDLDFYLGDQWTYQEKNELALQGRAAYVFNKIKRVVNMITGYQRKNRLSSVVTPVENSDQATADQMTELMLYVMQRDGYETISDAFSGALKTGLNLIEVYMDYRYDPLDGDIAFARIPYNSLLLDPFLTKLDLSDCNYLMRRKYMSRRQAKSFLPMYSEVIDELPECARDDKYQFMPEVRQTLGKDILAVDEYWKQNYQDAYLLVDPMTGQMAEMEANFEALALIMQQNPQIQARPIQKPVVERYIIIGKEVISMDVNPLGINKYPFVPFVALFEPETNQYSLKYQSIVRALRDPQVESNRRRSQMTDIIESSINSGFIAKENSVVNPRSLFESGQGKVTWVKEENSLADIQPRIPAQVPPSMFQLQELYDRDIMDISGVTEELLGAADDTDTGITVKLRQGAGLVTLQDLFDRLRYSQKLLSGLVLNFIQRWSPQKVQRILNEQPTQEFYNEEFGKYDSIVQEGVLTDTQRQMFFLQLLRLKEVGEYIPPGLLTKAAPIQGKTDLMQEIQAAQEAESQKAQAQEQMVMEDRAINNQNLTSLTESNMASAEERRTRALANLGLAQERQSGAETDKAQAQLDRAKALKELESMETDRIIKLMNLAKQLEGEPSKETPYEV